MHENCRLVFDRYAKNYFAANARVLEIGPDRHPSTFRQLLGRDETKWDTLDIRSWGPPTYISADGYHFPVPSGEYDIVFSASVAEHVREVWTWMKELARVCRVGGRVITICPTSWPYHEAPVDCWRIYPEGMMALYRSAGLEVEVCASLSLEEVGKAWRIPGRSLSHVKDNLKQVYQKSMAEGGPCECAYDTIAIGRKL